MISIKGQDFNKDTILEIGKFAVLWNVFECDKCNNNCTIYQLETLASSYATSDQWKAFAVTLKARAQSLSSTIDYYVDNHLSLGRGLDNIQRNKIKEFINTDGCHNFAGGLIAMFRIRNNMFHGLKSWGDLDNQVNLFKAMNAVLEDISK